MAPSRTQVAVIGAGPYGLAAAAHLRGRGVETMVFGQPMEFWEQQMPKGMLLRSAWYACDISDPVGSSRLEDFRTSSREQFAAPVPLDSFVRYGHWFQDRIVPDLDRRRVERIEKNGVFRLHMDDGETLTAERVVVAAGISRFANRPPEFSGLPSQLASHSSEHRDLTRFRSQRVLVIGGGQSAFEGAALLKESGAEVELVMRAPEVRWLHGSVQIRTNLGFMRRLLYPPTDVGPPGLNQLIARPHLFRLLPRALQTKWAYRAIRPAAATWLRHRMDGVRITVGRHVTRAGTRGDVAEIELDDGTHREIDHVVLATGYKVDVSRYGFLSPEVLDRLKVDQGYPRLSLGLESSIEGLHFMGAPAARSFGPLVRFVSGTGYSARALAHAICRRVRR
ncbi:MAG TPA: FAD-dependent oxidoreductase [Candidatus Binataceae bacterium]|nr:FAD-dependent oxidoreductase [Candidatus Binataceae bacterium]